jgi:hypothetical protein
VHRVRPRSWIPARNHPYLNDLVDRIIAVDPSTDRAAMRTRDWLLFSLWPAMGEKATLDRVRKAIRTPQYKRELKLLPRARHRSSLARSGAALMSAFICHPPARPAGCGARC